MTLFDSSGVLIQGITGREGRMTAAQMIGYGTRVVAGVTPGKGGESVCGIPVYDSISDAVAAHGHEAFGTSVLIVPPLAVRDAALEAIHVLGCDLVIATEGMPRHDALRVLDSAASAGIDVVGPNSTGVIVPACRRKLGAIGGDRPERAFAPGFVGVISRSGGMTAEIGLTVTRAGMGVSGAMSVGGDDLIGTPPAIAAQRLQNLGDTRVLCYFGEPGTTFEEEFAEAIASGDIALPVVALIAGTFTESLPEGTAFGHAAAIIRRGVGKPSDKRRVLKGAGATVVESLEDMVEAVLHIAEDRP